MPRYFSNGLRVRTGRTRTLTLSLSKSNLSPGRTPSARRISCGTVICPLLVMRAIFFMIGSPFLTIAYHSLPEQAPTCRLGISRLEEKALGERLGNCRESNLRSYFPPAIHHPFTTDLGPSSGRVVYWDSRIGCILVARQTGRRVKSRVVVALAVASGTETNPKGSEVACAT